MNKGKRKNMNLFEILSKPKFLGIFIVLSFFLAIIYLVVTGIYIVSLGEFIDRAEPLRVALTLIISTLTALAVTLMFYKSRQPLVCSQNTPAFLGSFAALFTTGCPVCFPLLLQLIGVGGATGLAVSSNAVPIQIASIALLSVSIYLISKN